MHRCRQTDLGVTMLPCFLFLENSMWALHLRDFTSFWHFSYELQTEWLIELSRYCFKMWTVPDGYTYKLFFGFSDGNQGHLCHVLVACYVFSVLFLFPLKLFYHLYFYFITTYIIYMLRSFFFLFFTYITLVNNSHLISYS